MPGHLIMAPGFTPIGIAVGPSQPNVLGLQYVAVQRPFRMRWMAQGVANDNWMKPGRDVKLRIYAEPHARRTCGVLTIAAPPGFSGRRPFVLRTARTAIARGALRDQEARRLRLVVPPGRAHADFRLAVPGPGVPFTGARKVSLRLNDMSVAACG